MPLLQAVRSIFSFYGYTIIIAGFFIQAVVWGTSNSFGVFVDPLIKDFGWSRATVSGAASLGFLVHGFSSVMLGNLNDRFGPRVLMGGCGLFLGAGFLLTSRVQSPLQLYLAYGLVMGLGLGGADVIPLSTAARWFNRKRGMMSGLIKVGTGVGMLSMPFVITRLINGSGWRTTFAVLGVVIALSLFFLSCLLVRNPETKGQRIDNGGPLKEGEAEPPEGGLTFKQAIRTRQLWTLCSIYFIILVCVYTILIHIVQHAIDLGIPSGVAAGILATVGGVSITGRFLMGSVGDSIGEKRALLFCLGCLLSALLWLQVAGSLWMFYLFAVVYGFAHGGFFTLSSPLIARLFGTRAHGILFGVVILSSTLGGAMGPFVGGYIFDVTNSYRFVFVALAILSLIAIGLTASLKPLENPF